MRVTDFVHPRFERVVFPSRSVFVAVCFSKFSGAIYLSRELWPFQICDLRAQRAPFAFFYKGGSSEVAVPS